MRILVFGDSITQGFYDPEKGGWCNRLEQFAQQQTIESDWNFDKTFFNLGISGGRTSDLIKRFESEILARKDNQELVILIATGANDSVKNNVTGENWCPFVDFASNYLWLIETGQKHGTVITVGITPVQEELLNPIPWFTDHSYYQAERDRYNAQIERLALELGVTHIDMHNVFGDSSAEFLIDGVHPNTEGHRLIYERVKGELEKTGII